MSNKITDSICGSSSRMSCVTRSNGVPISLLVLTRRLCTNSPRPYASINSSWTFACEASAPTVEITRAASACLRSSSVAWISLRLSNLTSRFSIASVLVDAMSSAAVAPAFVARVVHLSHQPRLEQQDDAADPCRGSDFDEDIFPGALPEVGPLGRARRPPAIWRFPTRGTCRQGWGLSRSRVQSPMSAPSGWFFVVFDPCQISPFLWSDVQFFD